MNGFEKSPIRTWHRLMSLFLVFVVLMIGLAQQRAFADDPPQHTDDPPTANAVAQPECNAGIAIAIVVIVVGAYVIYKLYKFCKRVLPPTPPPAPPPPTQTNNPAGYQTGNGFKAASGQILASETMTFSTNGAPEILLNPADEVVYAIEAYGYTAPDGSLYHSYMDMKLATSTNLVDWDPLNIKVYVSDTSVLTQVGTNGAVIQPRSDYWRLDLYTDPNASKWFLRSQSLTNSP